MILAWLLLLTGLTISAVAIYYSVIGLAAIFAAATIPIYIMGGSLEVAKLVCATWLKANWSRTPVLMKVYMTTAVLVLMFITSMGIFGFLSKAHTDQNLIGGDIQSKIAVYDEQIKTERENIDAARTALSQMDAQVNERLSRSTDDRGAERAVQIRRQQQAERARLQKDIASAQANISRLNQERSPIAAEIRKVEAEVGPIKYIAAFVYGDNPDSNLLEKAVTWVIILIVAVFDPLAVIMLLAAQMTFQWFREQRKEEEHPPYYVADVGEKPTKEEWKDDLFPTYEEINPTVDKVAEANAKIAEIEKPEPEFDYPEPIQKVEPAKSLLEQHPYLTSGFKHFANLEPMVYKAPEAEEVKSTPAPEETSVTEMERPGDYLILPELEEESKKKTYMIKKSGQQIIKTKE